MMDLYIAGFWLLLATLTILAIAGQDRPFKRPMWRGQPVLQVTALLWVAALLSAVLRKSVTTRFASFEPVLVIIDFALFAGVAGVGSRSGKWWVLWTAALQLISASAHIVRLVTPGMWRLGYQVMEEASSYPVLALLAWGIVDRHLAQKRCEHLKN